MKTLRGDKSKSAFARFLGIKNPSTYFYYEEGRVPPSRRVKEIADRCQVTADWLLGRSEDRDTGEAIPRDGPGETQRADAVVRDPACLYPADCDIPEQLSAVQGRLDRVEDSLSGLSAQMDTLLTLLGAPLRSRYTNNTKAG